MLECQKLNRNIPRLKWSEPVLTAIARLMDAAIEFTASHFYNLLNSSKFVDIDKVRSYINKVMVINNEQHLQGDL